MSVVDLAWTDDAPICAPGPPAASQQPRPTRRWCSDRHRPRATQHARNAGGGACLAHSAQGRLISAPPEVAGPGQSAPPRCSPPAYTPRRSAACRSGTCRRGCCATTRPAALEASCQPTFDPEAFVSSKDTLYIACSAHQQQLVAPLVVGLLTDIRHAVYGRSWGRRQPGRMCACERGAKGFRVGFLRCEPVSRGMDNPPRHRSRPFVQPRAPVSGRQWWTRRIPCDERNPAREIFRRAHRVDVALRRSNSSYCCSTSIQRSTVVITARSWFP